MSYTFVLHVQTDALVQLGFIIKCKSPQLFSLLITESFFKRSVESSLHTLYAWSLFNTDVRKQPIKTLVPYCSKSKLITPFKNKDSSNHVKYVIVLLAQEQCCCVALLIGYLKYIYEEEAASAVNTCKLSPVQAQQYLTYVSCSLDSRGVLLS